VLDIGLYKLCYQRSRVWVLSSPYRGYNSILVVCDRFSKILHFIATTEQIMAEGLVNLFRDNIIKAI